MDWVIGDIHGMLRPLEALVSAVEAIDPDRHLVFVGDYINRGPDSRAVVDFMLALGTQGVTTLRGNHDDVFQLFLTGQTWVPEPGRVDRMATLSAFLRSGLDATLLSYGFKALEVARMKQGPSEADVRRVVAAVPGEHRLFFERLAPCRVTEAYFVTHAYWPPEEASPEERCAIPYGLRRRMMWERFEADDLTTRKAWDRPGYFGHTPTVAYLGADHESLPIQGESMTLLDTGCFREAGGRLTAVCTETGQVVQVTRAGERVREG